MISGEKLPLIILMMKMKEKRRLWIVGDLDGDEFLLKEGESSISLFLFSLIRFSKD